MKFKKTPTFIGKNSLLFLTFFYGTQLSWAEDKQTQPADNKHLATSSGTCDNITPAKDIHELLLQIYTHLDDTCLYFTPTEELSKKLGVKIFSTDNEKGEYIHKFKEAEKIRAELYNMPMDCGNLSCYVYMLKRGSVGKKSRIDYTRANVTYVILPTKAYANQYDGVFPKHRMPYLIPPPQAGYTGMYPPIYRNDCATDIQFCHNAPVNDDKPWGEFFYSTVYDWEGKKGWLYFRTFRTHAVPYIHFQNHQYNKR